MKILIGKNTFDKTICCQKWFNGETPKGTKIVEIEEQFQDCVIEDFGKDLSFSVEKYNARKQKESASVRLKELKQLLANTDYQAIKFAEGQISTEDYEPMRLQRQAWRDEINELEGGAYE